MQVIEKMPSDAVSVPTRDFFVNTMAVMCGLAVLVFICMTTSAPGIDLSTGFF